MDTSRPAAPPAAPSAAPNGVADDLSALAWVHEELRKTLEQAHKGLRRYLREVEAAAHSDLDDVEPTILRNARQHLHEGVGALQLVNVPEGATLLRASEAAVQRYVFKPQRLDAKGVEAIERASFALLDYLGRRLGGKPADAVGLFPQLKTLLELNAAERIHPADLWPHDWRWLPVPTLAAAPHAADAALLSDVERRMLALVKQSAPEAAAGLTRAFGAVAAHAALAVPQRLPESTLWAIAAAFFEVWGRGLVSADNFVKRTGSRAMAALRSRVKGEIDVSERLAQDLLFFCARATPADDGSTPYLALVRRVYALADEGRADYTVATYGRHDPTQIQQARKRMAAAKETWNGVAGAEPQRRASLVETFSLAGDSIRRLYPSGGALAEALTLAAELTARQQQAPAPQLAMEVATSLLYVEAALDEGEFDHPDQARRTERLAERIDRVARGAAAEPLEPWMEELYRRVSDRQTMGSVVQELRASLAEAERQIDQFFRSPAETGLLAGVPEQMTAMRGVFSVLAIAPAMQAVARMRSDVEQLLHGESDPRNPIAQAGFQRLASNLGALGFLIDMLSVQPQMAKQLFRFDMLAGVLSPVMGRSDLAPDLVGRAQAIADALRRNEVTLDQVSAQLAALSAEAQVSEQPALAATLSSAQTALEQAAEAGAGHDTHDVAREYVAQAMDDFVATATSPMGLEPLGLQMVSSPMALDALDEPRPEFAATGLEDDDEMRGVFLEESAEVLADAQAALHDLTTAPSDLSALTTVRRAFHTLKGSSRMVGFAAFGEAAWACEQLYNHALAEQRPASAELRTLTDDALGYFAAWVSAIGHGREARFTPEPVIAAAETLRLAGELLRVHLPGAAEPDAPPHSDLAALSDLVDLEVPLEEVAAPVVETLQATQPLHLTPAWSASGRGDVHAFEPLSLSLQPQPEPDAVDLELDFDVEAPLPVARLPAHEPVDDIVWAPTAPADTAAAPVDEVPFEPIEPFEPIGFDLPAGDAAPLLTELAPTAPLPLDAFAGLESAPEFVPEHEAGLTLDLSSGAVPFDAAGLGLPADSAWTAEPSADAERSRAVPLEGLSAAAEFTATDVDSGVASGADAGAAAEAPLEGLPPDEAEAPRVETFGQELSDEQAQAYFRDLPNLDLSLDLSLEGEAVTTSGLEITESVVTPDAVESVDGVLAALDALAAADAPETGAAAVDVGVFEPVDAAGETVFEADAAPEGVDEGTQFADMGLLGGAEVIRLDDFRTASVAPAELPETASETAPGDVSSNVSDGAPAAAPSTLAPVEPFPARPRAVEPAPVSTFGLLGRREEDDVKVVGPLRLSIPLFNIYLNEADELSRRLNAELTLWALELHRPVGETATALAHSLAGSSATVGFKDLSQLARELEHALDRSLYLGAGEPADAELFNAAADEIRRLLHQFAAGFLQSPPAELHARLQDWQDTAAARQPARAPDTGLGESTLDTAGAGPLSDFDLPLDGLVADTQTAPLLAPVDAADATDAVAPLAFDLPFPVMAAFEGADQIDRVDPAAEGYAGDHVPADRPGDAMAAPVFDPTVAPAAESQPVEAAPLDLLDLPLIPADAWPPAAQAVPERVSEERVPDLALDLPLDLPGMADATADTPMAAPAEAFIGAPTDLAEALPEIVSAWPFDATVDLPLEAAAFVPTDEVQREPDRLPVDLPIDLPVSDLPVADVVFDVPADPAPAFEALAPVERPRGFEPSGIDLPLDLVTDLSDERNWTHPSAPVPLAGPFGDLDAGLDVVFDGDGDIDQVDQVDTELFPIFDEEAQELLPQLAHQVIEWLHAPADPGAATACMRTLHTFKGSARLAGAMRLGELAHRFESAIERLLAPGAVSTIGLEDLQRRVDLLRSTFESVRSAQGAAPVGLQGLTTPNSVSGAWLTEPGPLHGGRTGFGALSGLMGFEPSGPAAHPEFDTGFAPAPDAVGSGDGEPGEGLPTTFPAALDDGSGAIDWSRFMGAADVPTVAATERGPVNAQPVRVRAPLLDRLVNLAGEVSITRSRLEAEIGSMRGSLVDLTDNLDRLNQQLRDIGLQAETQLESRLLAAKAASQAFDPLELDRYTRLQELTRMMAESVNDVATVRSTMQRTLATAEDELAVQARLTRELQGDLLRTRMVEFESLSERLYRVVRQAAKETGKQVRFDIVGGSIEVDRGVLDRMTAAFEHLLRNCVTHGIEPPAQRQLAGKDPTGSIVVSLEQEGNEVSVELRDDGVGLDLPRIRERAVAMGLIAPDAELDEKAQANLIFAPGLSTVAVVTELAGRGVGMDVVRSDVHAMGGRIETRSQTGRGTRFKLVLPLTTVVTQVVILRAGVRSIAVPSNLVELVQRATPGAIDEAYQQGRYSYGGLQLPFFWLGALLEASGRGVEVGRTLPVVIVRSAQQRVALHVDEIEGSHEVVVKNLGPQLSRLPGLAGMTLLASGAVALIYNPVALAAVYGDAALRRMHLAMQQQPTLGALPPGQEAIRPAPLVLVVDDSLTVRRVTKRLLEREGYRVALAKDGLEALDALAGERPVAVLSDIEMPRMDGFDLLRNIRGDAELASLPVIMITSRIAQKHRDIATELGANHYLGKPYSEEELLGVLRQHASAVRRAVA